MNKEIMIIATASSDDMIPRLRRAGADRVVSVFRIAAQFVLLSTTRPAVSDFLQYVLYNYQAGIETTELYIQDNTPWIGQTIEETRLGELYKAWVIGVRQTTGRFIYAPSEKHVIQLGEVLIAITPMKHADTIRLIAHGGISQRPRTMRL
jgi:voltage-gated potassium channel